MKLKQITNPPILTDYCQVLEISHLKRNFYLGQGKVVEKAICWSGNQPISNLDVIVTAKLDKPQNSFMELTYISRLFDGDQRVERYIVPLALVKTNLQRGFRTFFICPKSGIKSTKLYRIPGYSHKFLNRTAHPLRIYYPIQTKSKKHRAYSDQADHPIL